jgi:hypothetical protein
MSDWNQNRQKKEEESLHLSYFLDAYAKATGENIKIVEESERPDFICTRESGAKVGIELTRVVRAPEDARWDHILHRVQHMSAGQAIERLRTQVLTKDQKRSERDWKISNKTILVIQLMDIPLYEIEPMLSGATLSDLERTGFVEIWVADFTAVEVFGGLELYALRHPKLKGN